MSTRVKGGPDEPERPRQSEAGGVRAVPELRVDPLHARPGMRIGGVISVLTRAQWTAALDHVVAHATTPPERSDGNRDGGAVHLELSQVSFVDVGGAAALVVAARRLGEDRRLIVHDPPPSLDRILEVLWPGETSGVEVFRR